MKIFNYFKGNSKNALLLVPIAFFILLFIGKSLLIIAGFIFFILIFGVVVYFYFKNKIK